MSSTVTSPFRSSLDGAPGQDRRLCAVHRYRQGARGDAEMSGDGRRNQNALGSAPMYVAEIWRYPVKSMRGEQLRTVDVLSDGIRGDRIVHAVDARERLVTARRRPGLLALHGTLGPDGEPLVDGRPWQSTPVTEAVEAVAGSGARLVR